MSVTRFLRTIRYLRLRQVASLAAHRMRLTLSKGASPARSPTPDFPGLSWQPRGPFLPSGALRHRENAEARAGIVAFLGEARHLGWPPDWQASGASRLWQYHLHYLELLWACDFSAARRLTEDWIAKNGRGGPSIGWEPYPLSLRVINLTGVFFGKYRQETANESEFRERLWKSIHDQLEWLTRNLETHLLGNHLLENAGALVAAGTCFAGASAHRWRHLGLRLLHRELDEQVLPDGGHFERSPMYQTRVSWLLAFLLNIGEPEIDGLMEPALERSIGALPYLCHPDSRIALLNDSAFDMVTPAAEVIAYARTLLPNREPAPQGAFSLPDTGYCGFRGACGDYVVVDAAPIGPDYQPGHGHADLLSFEVSFGGKRIVTDSGNFDYEESELRAYCRATRAHNTVEIEGQDQCEMWKVFRVGRRARPRDLQFSPRDSGFGLSAWHDGYDHLVGKPRHRREIGWWASKRVLLVRDTVEGSAPVRSTSRIHLHPGCQILQRRERDVLIARQEQRVRIAFAGVGVLRIEQSLYCPRFGQSLPRPCLVFETSGGRTRTAIALMGGEGGEELSALDPEQGAKIGDGWYRY